MSADEERFELILETLRRSAAALRDAEIPFVLGGSIACWARGGPESMHDLDLMVRPQDAEAALEALAAAGLRIERPPQEWLYKAWDGDILVDLIYRMVDRPVSDEVIARGEELKVASMHIRVMALEDVLTTKLLALGDHDLDYAPLLQIARSLRERIDWDGLRQRTAHTPYARAYFTLLEGLGIIAAPSRPSGEAVTVRPTNGGRVQTQTFGPQPHAPH
jgi:predicted nucleotidyltransferase